MITLAHISDIHLSPMPAIRPRDLVGKRLTGFLNWKLKRHGELNSETLAQLVAHMQGQNADFTAVTGDMTNLALPFEIERAGDWLRALGASDKVAVCPGNHDAYVPGALATAQEDWGDYLKGETLEGEAFPFVRRVGDLAIISCSSAVPTAPFMAIGRFEEKQAARLARILKLMGDAGYFRTVLIHHPPNAELQHPSFGLKGHRLFRQVIAEHGAELVLHGHTHRSSIHHIPGKDHEVPVIGVAAASAAKGGTIDDPARYNLFRIERAGEGWQCTMREFGFQRLGSEIVMRMQMRIY
ncbi:Calcineurin-like phosphoesterase superfamily domain protein [Devosia equisanguinis]|uniref:Calcineurin-like phosphoesterase superfamily domain protein n=1 Tax=Devosia equisanguinis TaxID=2490941 RepID=A0A3S4CEW0_9HYPH|nr:metallophosphoesterase [Devosia equisanguinis]VDS05622.1 Calcineurin-like phosphoesterase superfamily domain protein [Devosia equisanguinis]